MSAVPTDGDYDVRRPFANHNTESMDQASTNGNLHNQLSHDPAPTSNISNRNASVTKPCLVHRPASSGDGDHVTSQDGGDFPVLPEMEFVSPSVRRHSELSTVGTIDMLQLLRQQKRCSRSRSPPPDLALLSATSDGTSTSKDTASSADPLQTPQLTAGDQDADVGNQPLSLLPGASNTAAQLSSSDCPIDGGPLAQAVVVALCDQHRLHYRGSLTGAAATTSTASSSRFSPPSFSSADGDAETVEEDATEEYDNIGEKGSQKTTGIMFKSDSRPPSCGLLRFLDDFNTEQATVSTAKEADAESGYGASCSSSSAPVFHSGLVSSKRDKRRCRRRTFQRRVDIHTAENEFLHSCRCVNQNHDICNCSALQPVIPSPSASIVLPEVELDVGLRSATSSRTGQTGRHKRNRVRILDGRTPPTSSMAFQLTQHRSSCPDQRHAHSHLRDRFLPSNEPNQEMSTQQQRLHNQASTGLSCFSFSDNELFRNRTCSAHSALFIQGHSGYTPSSAPHRSGSPSLFSTSITPSGFETSTALASILVSNCHYTSTQADSHPRAFASGNNGQHLPSSNVCTSNLNHNRCYRCDPSPGSLPHEESSVCHRSSPRRDGKTVSSSCLMSNDRPSFDALEEDQQFSELLSSPPPGDELLSTASTTIPPDRITLSSSDCSAPICCCSLRDSLPGPKSGEVSRNTSPSTSSTRSAWYSDIPMLCRLAAVGGALPHQDPFLPVTTAFVDTVVELGNSPISSRSTIERRRFSAPVHERQQIPRTLEEYRNFHLYHKSSEPLYEVNLTTTNSPSSSHACRSAARVNLVVDNVRFIIDPQVMKAYPETMLGRMLSSQFPEAAQVCHHNRNHHSPLQDIHVARNSNVSAHLFRAILDYYLLGRISCPPGVTAQALKEACDYFLIPFNQHTVHCSNLRAFLHEISNDGAHNLFQQFLESHILSLLVQCAHQGERECHLVIVTDDETIDWDAEYPPQMPGNELNAHIIYSTQMFRFLKYIENREVAKQVLSERGLKKIRIGIEGYPTSKDRVKFRPGIRPEAIYNYVQCPFLRMSWEEEENKSRHVDFQCVKSRSVSDLTTGLEQAVIDPLPPRFAATGGETAGTGRRSPGRQSPPVGLPLDPTVDENTANAGQLDQSTEFQAAIENNRMDEFGVSFIPQVDTIQLTVNDLQQRQDEPLTQQAVSRSVDFVALGGADDGPNNEAGEGASEAESVS